MSKLTTLVNRAGRGLRSHLLMLELEKGLHRRWVRRQKARDAGRVIHVSSLVGKEFCARQAYYSATEGERPYEVGSMKRLMTFYEGDMAEVQFSEMVGLTDHIEEVKAEQQRLVGIIVGTPDKFIRWLNRTWLIEVKTRHSMAFMAMSKPEYQYLQQVVSYMWLYKFKRGFIVVKGKGLDEWKAFEVRLSQHKDVLREMVGRMLKVSRAVKRGTPPRRYCKSMKDKKAKSCPYAKACFIRDGEYR